MPPYLANPRLIAGSQTQSSVNAPSLLGASSANLVNLLTSDTPTESTAPEKASSTASTGPFSAAIAIGCLIKGSTMHFEYICDAVSHGLMRVQLDTGVPVIFGVLTALTDDQALERAGLGRNGNKGHSAYWLSPFFPVAGKLTACDCRPRRGLGIGCCRVGCTERRVVKGEHLGGYIWCIKEFYRIASGV